MPNQMPSGLSTHDATPAAWGCLGRRGDGEAMANARRMMKGEPTPAGIKHGSENHHLIQALINAVVFSDYKVAEEWLELVRRKGIGEGGALYFPAGDCGYVMPLVRAAEMDGRGDIVQQGREYLARVVEWMEKLEIGGTVSEIVTWLPSVKHPGDRQYQHPEPGGHVFFPGSRALFGHNPPGSGWYNEGISTLLYRWLVGQPKRSLPSRFSGYAPGDSTWDSFPWMTAMIYGMIPAKATAQLKTLSKAYRNNDLVDLVEGVEPGPYKLEFGMEVVRTVYGDVLHTASHNTASPKPPVNWVEYRASKKRVTLTAPDGLITYGSTGRGSIEWAGGKVWARAENDKGEVMVSRKYPINDVREHWVLPAKSAGVWRKGKLHPREPVPAPPPPEPPGEENPCEGKSGLSKLWCEIREWLREVF